MLSKLNQGKCLELNWMTSLFNIRRTQRLLSMFGKKKNNNGIVGLSLLGLGLTGATVFGFVRNRNINRPMKNMMNRFEIGKNGQMPSLAAITEFADEITPKKR